PMTSNPTTSTASSDRCPRLRPNTRAGHRCLGSTGSPCPWPLCRATGTRSSRPHRPRNSSMRSKAPEWSTFTVCTRANPTGSSVPRPSSIPWKASSDSMSTSSESRAAAEAADRAGTAPTNARSATAYPDTADPDTVLPAATTTGIWFPTVRDRRAGYIATSPVREAAAAGFDLLGQQLPPVPLTAHRAEDRWGAEAIGRAVGLLTDLHVDRTSFGWRLTASPGKDERLEDSAL